MLKLMAGLAVIVGVGVVMAMPPQILGPVMAVVVAAYLIWDHKRSQLNRAIDRGLAAARVEVGDESGAERLAYLEKVRAKPGPEAVVIRHKRHRLLADDIKASLTNPKDEAALKRYFLEEHSRIACGLDYEDLERDIVERMDALGVSAKE